MTKETTNKQNKVKPEAKQPAHILINDSFFLLPEREQRILIAHTLNWASSRLAEMEGHAVQIPPQAANPNNGNGKPAKAETKGVQEEAQQ